MSWNATGRPEKQPERIRAPDNRRSDCQLVAAEYKRLVLGLVSAKYVSDIR